MFVGRALALTVFLTGALMAAATTEEQQLANEQRGIEGAVATTRAPRPEVLAKEFGVTTETVTGLRSQNRGWGTITIELAMAQQLTKTDPATYPDMSAALAKVESLHAGGRGWGRIAQDLGFKLGPVVSSVQHARQEIRREVRADRTVRAERSDLRDRPTRAERPERPIRAEKPERPGKP
jgi:hypothetical protein